MRKFLILLCMVLMVLAWPVAASANISIDAGIAENQLKASGLESNAEVDQSYVDLSNTSNGTVTSATYIGANQTRTDNSFTVVSQTYNDAMDRITSYCFELSNQYKPDTDIGLSGIMNLDNPTMTVHIYTYGAMKDRSMYAIISGLTECLGNPPIRSSGGSSSWVNNYTPTAMSTQAITSFKIGSSSYTVNGITKTMDVTPVTSSGITFVPVRYLAYSLGVPASGVQWNNATNSVTITSGKTTIGLTIGSTTETVNGKPQQMDSAPYILNGRTMLPAQWVAQPLGATVTWDATTQQLTIKQGQ